MTSKALILFLTILIFLSAAKVCQGQLFNKEDKKEKDWSIAAFPLAFYQPETSLQLGIGGILLLSA